MDSHLEKWVDWAPIGDGTLAAEPPAGPVCANWDSVGLLGSLCKGSNITQGIAERTDSPNVLQSPNWNSVGRLRSMCKGSNITQAIAERTDSANVLQSPNWNSVGRLRSLCKGSNVAQVIPERTEKLGRWRKVSTYARCWWSYGSGVGETGYLEILTKTWNDDCMKTLPSITFS
jgi:hypothetical protein